MHFKNGLLHLVITLTLCLSFGAAATGQVFDYDFETSFPDFDYSFAYAGQGTPDCSTNVDNNGEVSATHDVMTGPTATSTLDATNWAVDPTACWTYVGWGLGMGHVFADNNQMLSSSDLSQYSITFDAWVEGTLFPQLEADFAFSFEGPELDLGTGDPIKTVTLGSSDSLPTERLTLSNTPQTVSFTLDQLPVIGGSISDWQNAPFDQTTQVGFQIEPRGIDVDVDFDDDNILYFDNFSLSAPFVDVGLPGDYDDTGMVGASDLSLVLANWGVDASVAGVPDGWINEQPTGLIGAAQLSGVLENWGNTASPPSVPEPSSVALMCLGWAACMRRRR